MDAPRITEEGVAARRALVQGLRTLRFELATKRDRRTLWRVAAAVALIVVVTVWRNVSYAHESLRPALPGLKSDLRDLERGTGPAATMSPEDRAANMRFIREQLLGNAFDVDVASLPGSVQTGLGLGAGVGGPLLGLVVAGVVLGSDLRRRTLFFPFAWGPSRAAVVAGKLGAAAMAGVALVTWLGVVGAAAGAAWNAVYEGTPAVGWSHPHTAERLLVLWAAAAAAVALWATLATALSLCLRSVLTGGLALVCGLAVDAAISTRHGVEAGLLAPRLAQLAAPFWPPASASNVDSMSYPWPLLYHGSRPAPTVWVGFLWVLAVSAALGALGARSARRWELAPSAA
jgi:hypothetical protein